MKENTCSKRYPRKLCRETQTGDDGYPEYKRRSTNDGGFTVRIKGLDLDNHWVVPYNPVLLRTFNCHINVEMCHSVKCIKYICKYVNKGSDQAAFTIENQKDEITMYESGRYISSAEAVWRILSFSIHERYPTVFHLAVHLENGQRVYFTPNNLAEKLNNPTKTTLLAFFELCKTDVFAKTLLYSKVPSYFVFKNNKFQRRKQGRNVDGWPTVKKDDALGRVYTIHPHNTECYYLRMLIIFFLNAPAGTGKTFLINLLLTKVRSNRSIALAVASSGISATLLEGGRTAHSAFKLPLDLINIETPMCNIPKQSNIAKVLRNCKFIVWDESTMAHKRGFEALDRSLKDIRNKNEVMGGATVLLTGDFRQTLPVIPRGSRADEVKACIKASYLWPLIEQLSFKKNMRVHLGGDVTAGKFSELLLKIGNGDFPELAGKLVITKDLGLVVTTLQELIVKIYPDIADIKNKSMK